MADWQQFAMLWGPAVPLALLLMYGHWHLLYRFLPRAAAKLEKLNRRAEERADERHVQFLAAVQELNTNLRPLIEHHARNHPQPIKSKRPQRAGSAARPKKRRGKRSP